MANVFQVKSSPKIKTLKNNSFSPERDQDNYKSASKPDNQKRSIGGLRGILGLGQTVDISRQPENKQPWNQEWNLANHLVQEQNVLFSQKNRELQKEIAQLRDEIQKLAQATTQLEHQVDVAIQQPIAQVSQYQVNFLQHLKTFISNFRKKVNEASEWLTMYQSKKSRKKGVFWANVKKGGEAYLFSGEHTAARSAT